MQTGQCEVLHNFGILQTWQIMWGAFNSGLAYISISKEVYSSLMLIKPGLAKKQAIKLIIITAAEIMKSILVRKWEK